MGIEVVPTKWPRVKLDLDEAGFGSITVNGEPLKQVVGVDYKSRPGEVAQLTIYMQAANLEADFSGDVTFAELPLEREGEADGT